MHLEHGVVEALAAEGEAFDVELIVDLVEGNLGLREQHPPALEGVGVAPLRKQASREENTITPA